MNLPLQGRSAFLYFLCLHWCGRTICWEASFAFVAPVLRLLCTFFDNCELFHPGPERCFKSLHSHTSRALWTILVHHGSDHRLNAHLFHLIGAYIFRLDWIWRLQEIVILLRIFRIQPAPCSAVTVAAWIEVLGYEVFRLTLWVSLIRLGNNLRKRCNGLDISRGFSPHLPVSKSILINSELLYLWSKAKTAWMFRHNLVDILLLLAVCAFVVAQIFWSYIIALRYYTYRTSFFMDSWSSLLALRWTGCWAFSDAYHIWEDAQLVLFCLLTRLSIIFLGCNHSTLLVYLVILIV